MNIKYRKLDSNSDMAAGHGNLDFYQDCPEAVAQAVSTRLKMWTGEGFLDITEGTPWMTILGERDRGQLETVIRDRILGTQGVTEILSLSVTHEGRTYTVTAEINTQYGKINVAVTQ